MQDNSWGALFVRLAKFWVMVRSLLRGSERLRYLVVGALSAGLFYVLFSVGWLVLAGLVPYVGVSIAAQVITGVLVYPVYRLAVFRSDVSWLPGFVKFYLSGLGVVLISSACMSFLVEIARVPVLFAQLIAIATVPVCGYPLQRFWAFRAAVPEYLSKKR